MDYMKVPSKASFKIDASRSSGSTDVPNSAAPVDDWDVSDLAAGQLPDGLPRPRLSMSPSGRTGPEQELNTAGHALPKGLAMLSNEADRHAFRNMTGSFVESCSQDDFMDDVLADPRKLESALKGYLNSREMPPDAK